jgi:hypothetical protein
MNIFKNNIVAHTQNAVTTDFSNSRAGSSTDKAEAGYKHGKKDSVFAGDMNIPGQDRLTQEKVRAHKKALKTILNQYTKDNAVDENIGQRVKNQTSLSEDAAKAQAEADRLKELKQQYKDNSGIMDGSSDPTLKEYDRMQGIWEQRVEEAKAGIAGENQAIESIKLSRLKSHPMVDAQEKEDDILKASTKEAMGILLSEAKDHIDEEQEKNKEEVEAAKEQKEKEDNAKDTERTDNPESAAVKETAQVAEKLNEADSEQDKMMTEIRKLIEKNKMPEEDSKGILLDEQV